MPATSLLACVSGLALALQALPPQTTTTPSQAQPAGERQPGRQALGVVPAGAVQPAPAPARPGVFFPPDETVREFVRPYFDKREAKGIVVGLVEPDGSRRVLTFGEAGEGARPLAAGSVFEIGSITKT